MTVLAASVSTKTRMAWPAPTALGLTGSDTVASQRARRYSLPLQEFTQEHDSLPRKNYRETVTSAASRISGAKAAFFSTSMTAVPPMDLTNHWALPYAALLGPLASICFSL